MRAVVITTVNEPTAAVRAFAAMPDHRTFVVADRKTPVDWHVPGVRFLADNSGAPIAALLPHDHYCRKMLGYLAAIEEGATQIVDSDDDNLPGEAFGFPPMSGMFEALADDLSFVNIYHLFTDQHIWPRGLPLDQITRDDRELPTSPRAAEIGVWQGLADGDPDVDAIYRLSDNTACHFRTRDPVVLGTGTIAPFNSQNTAFSADTFPLLYLPVSVTFRFTDILRGLVAQPILWAAGMHLGFTSATVTQVRNPHDYLADFSLEIPMYRHVRTVIDVVSAVVSAAASIADNLVASYLALATAGIVDEGEQRVVEAWLDSVQG